MVSLLVSSSSTTVLAAVTPTKKAIVIGAKRVLLPNSQKSYVFTSNTSMNFAAPQEAGWIFDHIEVEFNCSRGVTGSNVSNIFTVNNGSIIECGNTTGFYSVYFNGYPSPLGIRNISPINILTNISAYAFYSCITNATITTTKPTSKCTISFTVPPSASASDTYTIYWNGSCDLTGLKAPSGTDLCSSNTPKKPVYNYFVWGFTYMSFNPVGLAKQYSLKTGIGTWTISMSMVDASVSSVYVPSGFKVSIRYQNSTPLSGMTTMTGGASSPYLNLRSSIKSNLGGNWTISDFYVVTLTLSKDSSASVIDVKGALLLASAIPMVISKFTWYANVWICYVGGNPSSTTSGIQIRNKASYQTVLAYFLIPSGLAYINYKSVGQGLKFNLTYKNPTADVESSPKRLSSCYSLEITATKPLSSYALYDPVGSRAEAPYLVSKDQYYTLQALYGVYKVSFSPIEAWKVLGTSIYGTWQLNATSSSG
jgi:hypothetical protein